MPTSIDGWRAADYGWPVFERSGYRPAGSGIGGGVGSSAVQPGAGYGDAGFEIPSVFVDMGSGGSNKNDSALDLVTDPLIIEALRAVD